MPRLDPRDGVIRLDVNLNLLTCQRLDLDLHAPSGRECRRKAATQRGSGQAGGTGGARSWQLLATTGPGEGRGSRHRLESREAGGVSEKEAARRGKARAGAWEQA